MLFRSTITRRLASPTTCRRRSRLLNRIDPLRIPRTLLRNTTRTTLFPPRRQTDFDRTSAKDLDEGAAALCSTRVERVARTQDAAKDGMDVWNGTGSERAGYRHADWGGTEVEEERSGNRSGGEECGLACRGAEKVRSSLKYARDGADVRDRKSVV